MSGVKFGSKVGANVGSSGTDRLDDRVGFALGSEFEFEGELKARIQVGEAVYTLGLRDPVDRIGDDGGRTFWLL